MIKKMFNLISNIELPKYWSGSADFNLKYDNVQYQLVHPNSKFHKGLFNTYLSHEAIKKQKIFLSHFNDINGYMDIGANLGYYAQSVLAGKKFDQFLLFEPSKYNFKFLSKNFEGRSYGKVFNIGLSDKIREATISMPLSKYKNWYNKLNNTGILSLHSTGKFRKETIQLSTLNQIETDFALNIDNFFIKIDIEGHELFALRGMSKALKRNNVFLVEINATMGQENNAHVFDLFKQNNYSSYTYNCSNNTLNEIHFDSVPKNETIDVVFKKK